jgi:hypothetical protein
LGFWTEVRRWVAILVRAAAPQLSTTDALAVAALIHSAGDLGRVDHTTRLCRPAMILYLDEASRAAAGVEPGIDIYTIPDPHRPGTVYEGWWSRGRSGVVVGKAPQHPASHNFYRTADMDAFLRAAPTATGCD